MEEIKVNMETLKKLEKSNNPKVSATAALALNTNITYEEAEKKMQALFEECKHPTALQKQLELKFNH